MVATPDLRDSSSWISTPQSQEVIPRKVGQAERPWKPPSAKTGGAVKDKLTVNNIIRGRIIFLNIA